MIKKKSMDVKLEENTIYIQGLGTIDIDIIKDAYERIRQREGIKAAQDKGVHMGRPIEVIPEEFMHYYKLVESKSMTVVDAVSKMGISRATYYRLKNKYKNK